MRTGGGERKGLLVAALALTACVGREGPSVPRLDPAQVRSGEALYRRHCADCHETGRLGAPPHDSSGHTWHHADGMLYRIVAEGAAAYAVPGAPPGQMPAYADTLTPPQIRATITYLKSRWKREQHAFQQEVSRDDPFPE